MPIALSLVRVTKSYGAAPLLDDVSLGLSQGEKVGLIGRNGTGKSTMFRLLSGEESPDEGEIILTAGLRVARLSQDPHFEAGWTIRDAMEFSLQDHRALMRRHSELLESLHGCDPALEARLHEELERTEHHLNHMGWDTEPRMKEAATLWGLPDFAVEVETLSGGWRKRVALAQCWLRDPDVLVLDEPTNHLDPDQVEKLENWLQAFDGALLLITHDRHLLDSVVDRMLELEQGKLTSYDGSYSDYLLEKSDRLFRESRLTEHMQNRLRTEMAWLRRGAKARTRKSKLRIQEVLDLRDEVLDRTRQEQRSRIIFQNGANRSDTLLSTEGLHFSYENGSELIGGLEIILQRGMRIALLGPNGCGKSTLLRLMLGELEPRGGSIYRHPKGTVATISQGRGELDEARSILDNLADRASVINTESGTLQAHVYLTRFGFPVDQQNRLAGTLSGGERNRLLIARTMLQPSDLLVLDEPTNDLDIPTLQNLEEALAEYPGTLLLVSHDRFFLDQVATHTLAWNPHGTPRWELYEGSPATVRSLRAQRAAEQMPVAVEPQLREKRSSARAPKAGLSQKEQRRLAEVEAAMEAIQANLRQLEAMLSEPDAFLSVDAPGHELLKEQTRLQDALNHLETEWLELAEKTNNQP